MGRGCRKHPYSRPLALNQTAWMAREEAPPTKSSDYMKTNETGECVKGRLEAIRKEKEGLFWRLFTKKYVSVEQVPEQYRERFLQTGYRQPNSSFLDCIVSAFRPNNETFNIWTHFVPFMVLFVHFSRTFPVKIWPLHAMDHRYYPLLSLEVSICAYLLCSSMAHLFNCMSPRIRHICFYFDYAAIAMYGIGGSCSTFYYLRPFDSGFFLFDSPNLFMAVSCLCSLQACYFSCASRHRWEGSKYLVRTLAFTLPFTFGNLPTYYRFLECGITNETCSRSLAYCFLGWISYLVSAILNATRIPERCCPRTFDIIGHNHQWVHIVTTCGTIAHFLAVMNDLVERREEIDKHVDEITFTSSLGLAITTLAVTSAIAVWFGSQLTSDGHYKMKQKVS